MSINIQVEVYAIILIASLLIAAFIHLGNKVSKLTYDEKPKGIVNVAITVVSMLRNVVLQNMGQKRGEKYAPYISAIFLYIFFSNISGLFGIPSPTGNYSVTFSFAIISWIFIQYASIKDGGIKSYIKGFFEPIFPFVIPNFFGKIAPLISMSLRLFGNVLAGGVIMGLFYSFTGWISSLLHLGEANVIGVILAPALHVYFDLFSAFLQAFIFISLTTILTSVEFSDDGN